ncbi:heptaprenyl diphosphate synthase component 1 [Bacillus sp. FJAT-29790]|uniref:heptaprenyl diphosphate synthase component 1 n=1 Tax=Bacillus sp. FJAT-29790 TaxID=1895002 RepID=UPI0020B2F2B8|nr:heptaprenyl diphosphate synthase component 1 [Bacillus sp. FJAT-29790]
MKIKLADVKEQIEEKILHPYLLKYIESPVIDEDKLLLLISIIDGLNLPENKAKNYCITTMLIQIALDTHELVSNQKLESDHLKSRQLTVLAGVYYSGLYYKILSGIDDIAMIRSLAKGIKEVNEHKISVYQKAPESVERLMHDVKKIESSLFDKMTSYLHDADWSELASNLLFIKRLMLEKKLFLQGEQSVVFEALKKITFPKSGQINKELSSEQQKYLLIIFNRYIDFSKHVTQKCLTKLPFINELLEQRIKAIINQQQPVANTFVEEG